jgi:DNA-binding transcriptional regulator GbsR (MarR family)
MTNREMLTAVVNGELTDEVIEKAKEEIAKLDARNANRKNKPSKTQIENAPIIEKIAELLTDTPMRASEIAEALGISTAKASALAKKVEGVTITDVKVKGKGMQKGYSLA